jgi:serine/threonine protein phosphatase PrpC
MYAGYLLKRSNHPYRASPSPLPFVPIDHPTDESLANIPYAEPQDDDDAALLELEPAHIHSHIHADETNSKELPPHEESYNFITSLFGIDLPPSVPQVTNHHSSNEPLPLITNLVTVPPMKSLPIKMTSHLCDDDDDIATEIDEEDFCDSPPPAPVIPLDTIDPNDHHLWRVKYCVLYGDVLYFYSSQDVAESVDAVQERRRYSGDAIVGRPPYSTPHACKDLSQSPRPGRYVHPDETSHLWEKRVELQYVGTVRSAELEYGSYALELSSSINCGADEEEEYDKLVLRAANGDEMKEWLFQFMRCIASLVRDLVALRTAGDLHFPTPQPSSNGHTPLSPVRSLQQNGSSLGSSISFSPRYHKVLNAMSCLSSSNNQSRAAPLSHGHGRNAMRRRRQEASSTHHELGTLDPKSPELPFPAMTAISGMSSRLVTPMVPMAPESSLHYSPDIYPTMFSMDSPSPDGIASANASSASTDNVAPILPAMGQPEPWNSSINGESVSTGLPATAGKYIPPHIRNRSAESNKVTPIHENTPVDRPLATPYIPRQSRPFPTSSTNGSPETVKLSALSSIYESVAIPNHNDALQPVGNRIDQVNDEIFKHFKLGGCADAAHVFGSILDSVYIPRKASKLGKVRTHPFGYNATTNEAHTPFNTRTNLAWEIGAFSECGVRDFNEDSFLITSDILQAFDFVKNQSKESMSPTIWDKFTLNSHPPSLFAIFDGHCGDQASRYAAEKLTRFIYEESLHQVEDELSDLHTICSAVADILSKAVKNLDQEFCKLCVEDGREWESGSTALIAALVKEHLIVANLGDARGIVGRSVRSVDDVARHKHEGWNELPVDDSNGEQSCLWKEIADVHSPNRGDERDRIQRAGGWVTTEYDIPVAQLKRMALDDDDVVDILSRCFHTSTKASAPHRVLQISRVCGELAVSRALGDRDFKASSYNTGISTTQSDDEYKWDSSHLGLLYPAGHDQWFKGDLISNKPDFHAVRVGEIGAYDEFLLLACDGLWDVIDSDDAYRFTRDLLFKKNWSAKGTAGRLAELALHLGSSDNITVIVVRFFK